MGTRHFLGEIATGLALTAAVSAAQGDLPLTAPVPGGVAIVCVGRAPGPAPQVVFDGQRVLVARVGYAWHGVAGLPLALQPGAHEVSVLDGERAARAIPFKVGKRDYETQRVTLANRRQVEPEPEDLRRIAREQESLVRAFSTFSDAAPDTLAFDLPSEGRVSGGFGLRRFFNDEPRQPHSGLDIAAPEGTPIAAPAAGTVIEIGDYFFNGLTVVLDHGQGLVPMLHHLSRVGVAKGGPRVPGESIGAVGHTGRVTG